MDRDENVGARCSVPLHVSDYDYDFPKELIAARPVKRRDSSRLLVIKRSGGEIKHKNFSDLVAYLKINDVVVLNDTKVVPAALIARLNNDFKVTVLVLKKTADNAAKCLVKPAKKFKIGTKIFFDNAVEAAVIEENDIKVLRFSCPVDELLRKKGRVPLPPYIKRQPDENDLVTYQTVYAKKAGAVAAPTAGLHFTDDVLKKISKKGIETVFLTLHVGYGTFRPVRCENIAEHNMHKEWFNMPRETIGTLNQARKNNGRILAVGTTSCRVLETIARIDVANRHACSLQGETDIFIYPPYEFKLTDILLTNFHLPKTTLLMLVSAFCGHQLMMKAYKEAIERRYRLFSYGDAMLII